MRGLGTVVLCAPVVLHTNNSLHHDPTRVRAHRKRGLSPVMGPGFPWRAVAFGEGRQPVVLMCDSRGRLCALTGREARLPIREFLTDFDSATANPLVWGVR